MFRDPHLAAVGMFAPVDHPTEGRIAQVKPPVSFSASPSSIRRHAPALGEHTDEVLREAGLGDAEIAALRRDGAIV